MVISRWRTEIRLICREKNSVVFDSHIENCMICSTLFQILEIHDTIDLVSIVLKGP